MQGKNLGEQEGRCHRAVGRRSTVLGFLLSFDCTQTHCKTGSPQELLHLQENELSLSSHSFKFKSRNKININVKNPEHELATPFVHLSTDFSWTPFLLLLLFSGGHFLNF